MYEGWHLYGCFWGWAIDKQLESCKKRFPHIEWRVAENGHEILYRNGDIDGLTLKEE